MMILGLAPSDTCIGWALLDGAACSFVDLGIVPIRARTVEGWTLARARSAIVLAASEASERADGCARVVVEELPDDAPARDLHLLAWGAAMRTLRDASSLLTIPRGRWQREVLPNAGTQVDYDELAHNAATYLLANHPRASDKLRAIKKADRNHAIDAAMLALVGALRPDKCERIEAAL